MFWLVVLFVFLLMFSQVVITAGPRQRAHLEAAIETLKEENASLPSDVLEAYLKKLAKWAKTDTFLTIFFVVLIIAKYLSLVFGLDVLWLGSLVISVYLLTKGIHRILQPLPPGSDSKADGTPSTRTRMRKKRNRVATIYIVIGLGLSLAWFVSSNSTASDRDDATAPAPVSGPVAKLAKVGAVRRYEGEVYEVTLTATEVTDAELVHLEGLSRLLKLHLGRTHITDAGMVHLKGLVRLQTLTLHDTKITDAGLVHLEALTNLETLVLPTQITDEGLVHLRGLTKLVSLSISGEISDAGLAHFKGLTKLRKLRLLNTQVTDTGVAELQKALPDCKIFRQPSSPPAQPPDAEGQGSDPAG